MILSILTHPNSILREETEEVENPKDPEIQELIENMTETMQKKKGIGLAAPQVGKSLSIIVVASKEPMAFINPEIVKSSWRKDTEEEGCLSIPHIFGPVKRSKTIKVRALDERGKKVKLKAKGLLARVIQHEIDHLDGVLFIDRAKDVREIREL